MKKSLLLGITGITLVALTATTLYAQTATGTSIVDKMKAAVHAFTLATTLNPGQTGLDSAPIKGKKTGDILTAGEYNRILELISEGGGGGAGWVDVPLTGTENFDDSCIYRFKMQYSGREPYVPVDTYYYPNGISSAQLVWWLYDNNTTMHIAASSKNTLRLQWSAFNAAGSVVKIEKLCGGGAASSGGTTIVEWGLIKTSPKTISNWDLITLEGSWNSGGGDAAPTGGYIYKLNGQPRLSYVEASGISKDTVLTTTAQNVHNLTVKLSGDSVVIDPSSTNTLAYIVWKFNGGSGSSATCPSGFVAVGSYCIEPTMNPKGKTWYEAGVDCADKGAQLCQWSEWAIACKKGVLTDVKFGTTLWVYEWIDDYTGNAYQGIADPRVYSNCEYLSRADPKGGTTPVADIAYRCCSNQK